MSDQHTAGPTGRILYCGDDTLDSAAAYLSGIMVHYGLDFDHIGSEVPFRAPGPGRYGAYVLSDYPAAMLDTRTEQLIVDAVQHGAGLLMIGGWNSFSGVGGHYRGTEIAGLLPVEIEPDDDRYNTSRVCLMHKEVEHPILHGLPFDHPPTIAGFNRVTAREEAQLLLSVTVFDPIEGADGPDFHEDTQSPLLAVTNAGKGRVAAYMSDVAPHWVGGFVDWGESRISPALSGAEVEFGDLYARFWYNLLTWLTGEGATP